jgi:hypothetical protein
LACRASSMTQGAPQYNGCHVLHRFHPPNLPGPNTDAGIQYAAAFRFPPRALRNTGSPGRSRAMTAENVAHKIVIASNAKQSMAPAKQKEWIASSQVLLAMTSGNLGHGFAISQQVLLEVCLKFPPSPIRGRRECRAPDAPTAACAGGIVGRAHTQLVRSHRKTPGIPRAMVTTACSPVSGLFLTVADRVASTGLTPTSGYQDHTPSSASGTKAPSASTAAHPALMTFAQRPSGRNGMASDIG